MDTKVSIIKSNHWSIFGRSIRIDYCQFDYDNENDACVSAYFIHWDVSLQRLAMAESYNSNVVADALNEIHFH